MTSIRAVIADDEEQLRTYLKAKLFSLWPQLTISGEAENGLEALKLIESIHPDIAFLDIKMPGLSGLDVARKMTADCRVVFITAYDQYAVEAFENEAIDYILKPVTEERLGKTVNRLQKQLSGNSMPPAEFARTIDRLASVIENKGSSEYLKWIKARHGDAVRMIPVDDVYYFKAEDKYTVVKTQGGEFLIKTSIRQLSEELATDQFWRIHRGTIINVHKIARVYRSFTGRLSIKLKDRSETLTVSRSYAHLFKQM